MLLEDAEIEGQLQAAEWMVAAKPHAHHNKTFLGYASLCYTLLVSETYINISQENNNAALDAFMLQHV